MKVSKIIGSRCLYSKIDVDNFFEKYGKELVEKAREVLQEDILDRYDNEEYWSYDILEDEEGSPDLQKLLTEDILSRYDNVIYWDYDLLEEFVQDYLADKGLPVKDLLSDGTFKEILSKVKEGILNKNRKLNAIKWSSDTTCDFCKKDATQVGDIFYDGKTILGPWALMCKNCFRKYGVGLGLGRGQMYDSRTKEKIITTEKPIKSNKHILISQQKDISQYPSNVQEVVRKYFTGNPNSNSYETVDVSTGKKIVFVRQPNGTIVSQEVNTASIKDNEWYSISEIEKIVPRYARRLKRKGISLIRGKVLKVEIEGIK